MGETPLMVNRFDEKSKRQMEEKQLKKAKVAREARDIKAEFESTMYKIPGKRTTYAIPAAGLKNCAVSACRFVDGVAMTTTKGCFQVINDVDGLIPLKVDKPVVDERIVRVGNFGNKKPMTRYRAKFEKWSCTFDVKLNENVMSVEQLMNLYETAGFHVGLCEYRPEKSGNYGMFSVARS